jgi:hypothetical protein
MTFGEYCQYREGLWLNDKNAVVGLSKIAPPKPPKKTRQPAPPRIKPVAAPPPPKPVGEVQLPDALTMMGQMGINLVEPSRDQMKRLVDKAKNRVIVPQQTPPQSRPGVTPRLPTKG